MGSLHKPTSTATTIDIPIIDISSYLANNSEAEIISIAKQLHNACQSPGFFQITGHSVPSQLCTETLSKLSSFFALPLDAKRALDRNHSPHYRGYEGVGDQKLEADIPDQKEGFMIGPEYLTRAADADDNMETPIQVVNQWPSEELLPGFRETFTAYFDAIRALSKTMFRLMALSLDLDEFYFDDFVGSCESMSMCRAHRYPPTTSKELALKSRGIGAHTDFGALTLLLQDDVGGLEVYHKPAQTWHAVQPVKNAFVVNIGDMMERWTNNMYTSTLHRVISPLTARDRYSIAFFNEGLRDQVIECIPTCLRTGEKPIFDPIKAGDHLDARYARSY